MLDRGRGDCNKKHKTYAGGRCEGCVSKTNPLGALWLFGASEPVEIHDLVQRQEHVVLNVSRVQDDVS